MFEKFRKQSVNVSLDTREQARPSGADLASSYFDNDPDRRRQEKFINMKVELHQRLLDMLNLSAVEEVSRNDLHQEISAIVRELLSESGSALNGAEFEQLVSELIDEVTGLGPLEPLLQDDTVSDILVNTYKQVFVERYGRLELTPVRFKDDRHLLRIIDKIVRGVGRRVDESQPWVDARLKDGSRVNALVSPCAVDGPLLSIRKFARNPFSIEKLIEIDTLTKGISDYLKAAVSCRLNILVSGGTGSGKTTTLNALSSFISDKERIVTIEDTAELQLQQSHIGRMEARPANVEGKGAVSSRDLLRNALRMRPDRIIVGEVRGGEVLDMLQAMNTGHEGSMTTIHANSPRDALSRIENMIGMSGIDIPLRAVRAQISSAINVVVQIQRMTDGRRRVVSVQEITGMEADIVSMQEIFQFERTGVDKNQNVLGNFIASGIRSRFSDRFKQWGQELPTGIFEPRAIVR